jgi:hypothetical protein
MVLGTADEGGRPWVSPVYYAPSRCSELFWVSSPDAQHSRNLAGRPELSIVVFDSQAPVGEGQGVYMSAVAEQLTGADIERGIEMFSRVSVSHGAKPGRMRTCSRPRRCACTAPECPNTGSWTRSAGPINERVCGRNVGWLMLSERVMSAPRVR